MTVFHRHFVCSEPECREPATVEVYLVDSQGAEYGHRGVCQSHADERYPNALQGLPEPD